MDIGFPFGRVCLSLRSVLRGGIRRARAHLLYIPHVLAGRDKFTCPVCSYRGFFADVRPLSGLRKHAECPKCGALERHRLQRLVLARLSREWDFSTMRVVHFAPESFLRYYFRTVFSRYVSADIAQKGVDVQADLRRLPFPDSAFDLVYASHVLEHIKEDRTALREIRRVLSPGGLAILPVPLVSPLTIEYPEPNPAEEYHVRCPGMDYFDRYRDVFSLVRIYSSADFPAEHQTYVLEERTVSAARLMPLRDPIPDVKRSEFVPVCVV